MDLHMRQFDGATFGMSVQASNPAFKRMKKNAFTGKVTPHGWHHERTARCVRASDVAAAMGPAGWLVSEGRYMETIRWGSDGIEHYIIYEKELEMTNQKFEITDIAHEEYPFLHRIRALRDIGTEVKTDDLGGFVEHEGNLSFEPGDDAWIYNDAIAAGDSHVDKGAVLRDMAVACGHAYVSHGSTLSERARAEDDAYIRGALLRGFARASGGSMIMAIQDDPTAAPHIEGRCVVFGKVMGNVHMTTGRTVGACLVVADSEEILHRGPDKLVISEHCRHVMRDRIRDELRPRQPEGTEKGKKPKRKEQAR